jgi:uncharacterized protein (TIGR02611 family)
MGWVQKVTARLGLDQSPRLRKAVIAVTGITVLVVGVALIFLPGPGSIVIPLGLVILASEFAWARHILRRGKEVVEKARSRRWRQKLFGRSKS